MDNAPAARVAEQGESLIAGRFLDLGPWYIGFGIVLPLLKSEAMAISLACSMAGDRQTGRRDLHELVYTVHFHGENLVIAVLEPLIALVALQIDDEEIDMGDFSAQIIALLSSEPADGKLKAVRHKG